MSDLLKYLEGRERVLGRRQVENRVDELERQLSSALAVLEQRMDTHEEVCQ